MMQEIKLHKEQAIPISHLKGGKAIASHLQIKGKGTIFVCLLAFYKDGQDKEAHHEELFFNTPDFRQSTSLPARKKDFDISPYDFCRVKMLTGNIWPEDEISLVYNH